MTANRSSSAHTTQVKTGKRCDQDQNNTLFTLFGTLLVASGTATLNQYIERDFDAQMRRAQAPRGRPSQVACSPCPRDRVIGRGHRLLAVTSGVLASLLALLTLLSYLFKYTPLKRITPGCVLIGAFPGAVPPLIGWAAGSGRLNAEAWVLYAILFLWQFPHFMAIAWLYREDYARAGYLVLPRGSPRIAAMILQTLLPLMALIPLSLLPFPNRHADIFSVAGQLVGLCFLYFGVKFSAQRSTLAARRLLAASIVYLPLLFLLRPVCLFLATRVRL
jgi:protoheme IX farnesyltransferase